MNTALYTNRPNFSKSAETNSLYVDKKAPFALPVTDLMFLQATSNYSWLYWKDGQRMLMSRTLKYYQPYLPGTLFIRLHRNCIVNIHYIERVEQTHPDKGGFAYLKSGVVLPISRRRWYAVRRTFSRSQKLLTD